MSDSCSVAALVTDLCRDTDQSDDKCDFDYIEYARCEAVSLAEHLKIPLFEERQYQCGELYLYWDEQGLSLRSGGLSLRGDFSRMLPRLRYHNLTHEMLVKASKFKGRRPDTGPSETDFTEPATGISDTETKRAGYYGCRDHKDNKDHVSGKRGFRRLTAIDATAGMGEDSLLLAAAGFEVLLYEYDPVIAALLRDTLHRASMISELRGITSRMRLVEGDSIQALRESGYSSRAENHPDLIYLDPMFPEKRRKSLSGEKLQLIQKLEHPCTDEGALLEAALNADARRIVVKRPRKGPYLAGRKPAYSITGKTVRYDCYVVDPS